jgi:hypothetical protein
MAMYWIFLLLQNMRVISDDRVKTGRIDRMDSFHGEALYRKQDDENG